MIRGKNYFILNNSRFYILVFSILLSTLVLGYMRNSTASDQLFIIRLQQIYGLASIILWYLAVIIGPMGHIVGKHRTKHLEFMRRAIGVSAFYFALLHFAIAFWGQLGGLSQLVYMPESFVLYTFLGLLAFVVLLALAVTSFDAAIKYMSYRRWKWLHRLIYIGLILALLHIWALGTHLLYPGVRIVFYVMILALIAIELYPNIRRINDKYLHLKTSERIVLFLASWALAAITVYTVPGFIQNVNSEHIKAIGDSKPSKGHGH
jgi:DMSO/TMAO reductase YedYZ heme-binding membrane subunit